MSLSWLFRTLEILWGDFAVKLNLTPSSLSWFSEPKGSHLYLYLFLLMIVKYVFIIILFILPFAIFHFLFAALKSFWILKLSFCILARSLSYISMHDHAFSALTKVDDIFKRKGPTELQVTLGQAPVGWHWFMSLRIEWNIGELTTLPFIWLTFVIRDSFIPWVKETDRLHPIHLFLSY